MFQPNVEFDFYPPFVIDGSFAVLISSTSSFNLNYYRSGVQALYKKKEDGLKTD